VYHRGVALAAVLQSHDGMRLALCAALVGLFAVPCEAHACVPEFPGITPHELDPAYASDIVAPGTPQATFSISRHEIGGGCAQSDCDGRYADVYVDVTGGDDRTPQERLGYILTIAGGDTPAKMYSAVPNGMPVFQGQGSFRFGFDYDDRDFAFDVEIRTVDLNGNISEPTLLHIAEHDASGCSTTSPVTSAWLALLVLGFVLRRRRSFRGQPIEHRQCGSR
jgi:MYXO-CTERM domain-containing protein